MAAPLIPDPRLTRLIDDTGLTVFQYDKMAPGLHFCDVVVVKACFAFDASGISTTPSPSALVLADGHRIPDQPLASSLAHTGDVILGKPGADVLFSGEVAYARPVLGWSVRVVVGEEDTPILRYACAVRGPRRWRFGVLKGWHLSDSTPTERVPIAYELAWGGHRPDPKKPWDEWAWHPYNPCGSGFDFSAHSMLDEPPGTQWESDRFWQGVTDKALVGLGPVARFWASRTRYGGTYDAAWQARASAAKAQAAASGVPPILDYPADFDLRFFQAGHPSLQSREPLNGDERIRLEGVLAEAPNWVARLPGLRVLADVGKPVQLPLDTVNFDLAQRKLHLTWRLTLPQVLGITRVALWTETSHGR